MSITQESGSAVDEVVQPSKWRGVMAVLLGLLVDIGGSILVSAIPQLFYVVNLYQAGLRDEALTKAAYGMNHDAWIVVVSFFIGCIFSALGGYVCARVAKHRERSFGLIMAVISVSFCTILSLRVFPVLLVVGIGLCTFASVMLGVQLGMTKNKG